MKDETKFWFKKYCVFYYIGNRSMLKNTTLSKLNKGSNNRTDLTIESIKRKSALQNAILNNYNRRNNKASMFGGGQCNFVRSSVVGALLRSSSNTPGSVRPGMIPLTIWTCCPWYSWAAESPECWASRHPPRWSRPGTERSTRRRSGWPAEYDAE